MVGTRLLIVDDDVDFAESMADVLTDRGYQVELAHDGAQCLRKVEAGPFALVMLDMKMPGMDGVECLAALRTLRPGTPVVMVTAFTRSEIITQALDAGAVAVLGKPVAMEDVLETVAHLAGRGSLLVVDDDADLAHDLSALLTQQGYQVDTAADLKSALEVLERKPIDLILSDYRLPDGTGADLLAWLQARGDPTAMVVLTGYREDAVDQLPSISPQDILVKPFQLNVLMDVLSRHGRLESRSPVTEDA